MHYSPLEFEILRWLKNNHNRIDSLSLDDIRDEVASVIPHEEQEFFETLRWMHVEELIHHLVNYESQSFILRIKKDGLTALRYAPLPV